jgi:hypothetical protein
MMKVWVMQGIHEGEMFATTHLTEKGAALAAINEVLAFLEVDDEETALSAMILADVYTRTDGEQTEPIEWDFEKMKDMKRAELWKIFGSWNELTWENNHGYQIEISATMIAA